MAQSVKCLTLDLSSGFDLRVLRSSPTLGVKPILKKERRKTTGGEQEPPHELLLWAKLSLNTWHTPLRLITRPACHRRTLSIPHVPPLGNGGLKRSRTFPKSPRGKAKKSGSNPGSLVNTNEVIFQVTRERGILMGRRGDFSTPTVFFPG